MAIIKSLFFAANPQSTQRLSLDREIREISAKIETSEFRDLLQLISVWAVRPDDLLQSLNRDKPQIVHFSGHGNSSGQLILVDEQGEEKPVTVTAIRSLFQALRGNIKVVVLNACYTKIQAEAIAEVIDCVIGIDNQITDQAAITFIAAFYRAIGFRHSIYEAYEQGCVALSLDGVPNEFFPVLLCRTSNACSIILIDIADPPPKPDPGFSFGNMVARWFSSLSSESVGLGLLILWIAISVVYWYITFDTVALWVGGWYKSWYFREFSLPSEIHGFFSDAYYRHASWSTIFSAAASLLISSSVCLLLSAKGIRSRYLLGIFLLLLLLLPSGILSFWPFTFDPQGSVLQQLIGSRDFSLWAVALFAGISLPVYTGYKWPDKAARWARNIHVLLTEHSFRVFTFAVITTILLPLVAGLYLFFVGYFMGKYHGYSAIWEGKMNVRWARGDDKWWIFVAKTDSELYVLYDREGGVGRFFTVDEITEIDGPVTRAPRN